MEKRITRGTTLSFLWSNKSNRSVHFWIGTAILLVLTLCMFGDVLFTTKPVVLSGGQNDLASQFIYWYAFAADQLRHGHLPLWNPYVFCGTPFLGWAQAGVLYPTNWLNAVLPLPFSINLGVALHVFLAGFFTYWWALRRGLHPAAAIMSGALFMFSGAYFLHVYAGHLSLLYAMAWTPVVFTSIEGWMQTHARGWILWGMAAVALQIFAGDLQGWFYTAVAVGLFTVFQLLKTRERPRILLGLLAMYVGAAALGAIQLLTSFQAGSESVRGGGVSYEFASMVSFTPGICSPFCRRGFSATWPPCPTGDGGTSGRCACSSASAACRWRSMAPCAAGARFTARWSQSRSSCWSWPSARILPCFPFSIGGCRASTICGTMPSSSFPRLCSWRCSRESAWIIF